MAKKYKEQVVRSKVPKRAKAFLGNNIQGLKKVHERVRRGK